MEKDPQHPLTKESILKYITEKGSVTFVELQRDFADMRGTCDMSMMDENIVYWVGLSDTGAKMISELKSDKLITFDPVHVFTYLIDGATLKLPILRKASMPLKTPHWLPVTLNPVVKKERNLSK
jgi:hypothetical protein